MDAPKTTLIPRRASQNSRNSKTVNTYDLNRSDPEGHIPMKTFHWKADLNPNPVSISSKDHHFGYSELDDGRVKQDPSIFMVDRKRSQQLHDSNVQNDGYSKRNTDHGDGLGSDGLIMSFAGKKPSLALGKKILTALSLSIILSRSCVKWAKMKS